MILSLILLSVASIIGLNSHSTFYPHVQITNSSGLQQQWPPQIISWHVHIVYILSPSHIEKALQLRDKTIEHFKDVLGPECTGRFDLGRLCMIRDHNFTEILTEGPFPAGEWSIFVPSSYLTMIMTWMVQNRGEFSLLLHPNSGFQVEDHSIWASWTGDSWPLNLEPDVLGFPGEQSNEKNHYPGDKQNPNCVPSAAVCGSDGTGPTSVCCSGLSCERSDEEGLFRCKNQLLKSNRFITQEAY